MIDDMVKSGARDLPYLQIYNDRHGRRRIYYRRRGKRTALPGPLGSPAFHAAYAAAHAAAEGTATVAPRGIARVEPFTFAALIRDYRASPEFNRLAKTTRAEYSRVLNAIEAEDGHRLPRDLRRKDVRRRRDARAETPGAANTYLGVISTLMSWAIDAEFDEALTVNVCFRIARFRAGEWRAWTHEEMAAFEARWPLGTMERLAYALARYTGQRRADLVGMTRAHLAQKAVQVRQQKTGEPLWIPLHRELLAAIEAMPKGARAHMSLLTTSEGKAFDRIYFGAWFAGAIDEAGLPDDCVLHGLRKSTGADLAEAGATDEEIGAVLGHRTARMRQHYTRAARQKKLAQRAIGRVEKAGGRNGNGT